MKRQTDMRLGASVALMVTAAMILSLGGCGRSGFQGPRRAVDVSASRWSAQEPPAAVLKSGRYWIYTTLPKGSRRDALPQVLEGAYARYQALAPAKPLDGRPMHCFVFAQREEWEAFTTQRTGTDAKMYLQIPRGGYTIDDWFAAYSDNDQAIFSAVAHEGWHQYVARHFKGRLPPFLEEGVACLFEDVRMVRGLPRWDSSVNAGRARSLAAASSANQLWPLDELIAMHAGDVVTTSRARINAFYAQSWAFARFLNEAEEGRYRPLFAQLLADTAAGRVPRSWDSATTRIVLERSLRQDFASIERAFDAFVRQITATKVRE